MKIVDWQLLMVIGIILQACGRKHYDRVFGIVLLFSALWQAYRMGEF